MKKFKLFMAIAVVFAATFMTGCEKPKDDVKENTEQKQEEKITYRIEEIEEQIFYGDFIEVTGEIPSKAEPFWKEMKEQYPFVLDEIPRMAVIEERKESTAYWILTRQEIPSFKKFKIKKPCFINKVLFNYRF